MKNQIVEIEEHLEAPAVKVWDALTKPELVKKYFFGSNLDTDWKVGSPIYFRGEYQGKKYEDKGKVLEVTPGRHLAYSYWSGMAGLPDKPENYKKVVFDVVPDGPRTTLQLKQDNNADAEAKQHSEQNWRRVFAGLKQLVETGQVAQKPA